jgi:hypothetical protein
MKHVSSLVFAAFCFIYCVGQNPSRDKLAVEFNENIATYSIVERMVADKEGRLFYIDGKADDDYLPMVDRAFNYMSRYDNSTIIQQTLDYLKIVGNQQDLTYHALLRAHSFPQKGYKYSFEGLAIDSVKLQALKAYVENLRHFYQERKLKQFFRSNLYFINGAIKEVQENMPRNYVEKMENYYGEQISAFKFYINPFDVVPYDTDFWHGNGPKIKSGNGWIANMISSAYLPLKKETAIDRYKSFGFNHPATIALLITHEFGHSFVNHTLTSFEPQINKSASLLSSGLNKKMDPQGYSDWTVCITEHLVRLGEIRIAQTDNDTKRASELRDMHINKYSFVLIPYFEKIITEYEANRHTYKTFQDFMPRLLSVLDSITVDDIKMKLSTQMK